MTTVEIGTAAELVAFANRVNAGETALDAVLTADIDMVSVSAWVGIGTDSSAYAGTFDGNRHIISNLHITTAKYLWYDSNYNYGNGFIAVANGVSVHDLQISGNVYLHTNHGDKPQINPSAILCAGIVGGTNRFSRVDVSGTVDMLDTSTDNYRTSLSFGGIVGGAKSGSGSAVIIADCMVDIAGTVSTGRYANFGQVIGNFASGNTISLTNTYARGANINAVSEIVKVNLGGIAGIMYTPSSVSSCVFSGCIAIGNTITYTQTSAGTGGVHRLAGYDTGGIIRAGLNYANTAMTINGTTVTSPTTLDGSDVTPETYHTQAFWRDTLGWDFVNTWYWDSTENLPKLRVFRRGLPFRVKTTAGIKRTVKGFCKTTQGWKQATAAKTKTGEGWK